LSTNPQEWPAPPPLGSSGRPRRGEFFVGWVYGPWVASSLISVLALRLLLDGDGATRGLLKLVTMPVLAAAVVLLVVTKVRDGGGPTPWNLFGAGLICFSIGCLARTALASSEGPKP